MTTATTPADTAYCAECVGLKPITAARASATEQLTRRRGGVILTVRLLCDHRSRIMTSAENAARLTAR